MSSPTINNNAPVYASIYASQEPARRPARPVTIRVPKATPQDQAPSSLNGRRVTIRIVKPATSETSTSSTIKTEGEYVELPADLINPNFAAEKTELNSLRTAFKALGKAKTFDNRLLLEKAPRPNISPREHEIVKEALKNEKFYSLIFQIDKGLITMSPRISREILLEKYQHNYSNNELYIQLKTKAETYNRQL